MQLEFLCGCITGNIENRANLLTMDSIAIDDEGMLVCAYHEQRRKGWRSIPSSQDGMKFPYLTMTPAEIEGRILFKDPFPEPRTVNVNFDMEDRRNNYDPESIGIFIRTRTNRTMSAVAFLNANRHRELGK